MKIVEAINKDAEIQKLKKDYKEKYNKNAPPFNYDEYAGIDDYRSKLREMIEKHSNQ